MAGRGDVVFLHDVLGEELAAFEHGRAARGAEGGNLFQGQVVNESRDQRDLGAHDHHVDLFPHAGVLDGGEITGVDIDAEAAVDAAVSRGDIHLARASVIQEPPGDAVFPSAGTNHEIFHYSSASQPCGC